MTKRDFCVTVPAWIVVRRDGPKRALFWRLPSIKIRIGGKLANLCMKVGK